MEEFKMEKSPQAKILVIPATPALTAEQFDSFTKDKDAIVFLVFATGTSPKLLNDIIRQRTQEGTPVFLVANNPGDNHGIIKIAYDVQAESIKAGAIPIEKANINNLEQVVAEVRKQFTQGKKGVELGLAVQEVFSYKDGEERPIPAWHNPDEINKQKELTRNTLQGLGLTDQEVEAELKKMGF